MISIETLPFQESKASTSFKKLKIAHVSINREAEQLYQFCIMYGFLRNYLNLNTYTSNIACCLVHDEIEVGI